MKISIFAGLLISCLALSTAKLSIYSPMELRNDFTADSKQEISILDYVISGQYGNFGTVPYGKSIVILLELSFSWEQSIL
jgi:hypothetical protein